MKPEKKKQKTNYTGSIRIDAEVLRRAKIICAENKLLIQEYATQAIKDKNEKK